MTGIEIIGAIFLITMLAGAVTTVQTDQEATTTVKACLMCVEMGTHMETDRTADQTTEEAK